jgi:hypothetical protein
MIQPGAKSGQTKARAARRRRAKARVSARVSLGVGAFGGEGVTRESREKREI